MKFKKVTSALLALIMCMSSLVWYANEIKAAIIDVTSYGPGVINIEGLTITDEPENDENAAWFQEGTRKISGFQFGSGTDSLIMTATRTGRLGFSFVPTAEADGQELGNAEANIKFYLDDEEITPITYQGVTGIVAVMTAGQSFKITLESSSRPGAITMDPIVFQRPETYSITLKAPVEGGSYSYTIGGTTETIGAGDENVVAEFDSLTGIRLVATPSDGYKFNYWEDGNGNRFDGNSTVEIFEAVPGNTLTPIFMSEFEQQNFMVGITPYDTWADAFAAAANTESKTVVALRYGGEYTLPSDAEPDGTYIVADGNSIKYVIPEGFKLLVPYNTTEPGTFRPLDGENPNDTSAEGGNNQSMFAKLTVPAGVKLEVCGQLNVNAQQFKSQGIRNGQVAGQYGQLEVEAGATVDVKSGAYFYCYGYTTGGGTVNANSGAVVHELLQVCDWIGGSNAMTWFTSYVVKKQAAGEDGGSFAFSQYYAQNIECPYIINAGAESYMDYTVYVKFGSTMMTICAAPQFAGETGLFHINEGYMERHYDAVSDRMIYDFYGNFTTGNVSVDFSKYSVPLPLDSSKFILGINNHLTLNVKPGSYLKLNSNYQLLPEFTANVEEGGTMEFADGVTLYIWDKDDWNAGNFAMGGKARDMIYSPTRGKLEFDGSREMTKSTTINLDGHLIMHNNVYTTDNGGRDIGKAITSEHGTGQIDNSEGQTTANLRMIGRTDIYKFSGEYYSEESQKYYPTINCSVVVGHMYNQDPGDYGPFLTGEYHYKKAEKEGDPEGWYNRCVTIVDLDTGVETEYPCGTDDFVLPIDTDGQNVITEYQIFENAELDKENTICYSNRDGSKNFYINLALRAGDGARVGIRKEHYDYMFGWYEQSMSGSSTVLQNVWFDTVNGTPENIYNTDATVFSATQLLALAQQSGNQMMAAFCHVFGVDNFDDMVWALKYMNGDFSSDYRESEEFQEKENALKNILLGQFAQGIANEVSKNDSTVTAALNDALKADNHYVLIPVLSQYGDPTYTWHLNYPDGTTQEVVTSVPEYEIPSDERYVVIEEPSISGNKYIYFDSANSTKSHLVLASRSSMLVGEINVSVNLVEYAYKVSLDVTNTSTTDSSKVYDYRGNLVTNWAGQYTTSLEFEDIYVDANGKNVLTGEPIEITYEDIIGYSDDWRITSSSTGYGDAREKRDSEGNNVTTREGEQVMVEKPAKFAFKDVSAVNASATVENTRYGTVLKISNITGDVELTASMYGYHHVLDRTVTNIDDGTSEHELLYVLDGTALCKPVGEKVAYLDIAAAGFDDEKVYINVTPYDNDITSSENIQFTVADRTFFDTDISYSTKSFDYIIKFAATTATTESNANYSSGELYYVKSDETMEFPIPGDGSRYTYAGYYLFDLAGQNSLKSQNTNGEIVTVDYESDPEVLKVSGVTQDIKLIGFEKSYTVKVTWQDSNGNVLRKDYKDYGENTTSYTVSDGLVISDVVASYETGDGRSISYNSSDLPTDTITLTTNGFDYDIVMTLTLAGYDYEITVVGRNGEISETHYVSEGETVKVGTNYGIYSVDSSKRYAVVGYECDDGLTATGPANGNANVEWGWLNIEFAGFTEDATITLDLKEFNNTLLWNTDGFEPALAAGTLPEYAYLLDGETATLTVPEGYVVTSATKGAGPEYITDLTNTDTTVSATVAGNDCSVRVVAKEYLAVVNWVIDGETTTEYVFEEPVYKTLEGKRIITSASADNADCSFSEATIILNNITAETTVTATSQTYLHKLRVTTYDPWNNQTDETFYMTEETFTQALEGYRIVGAEVPDNNAEVTFTYGSDSFTVTNAADDEITIYLDVKDNAERLKLIDFDNRTGSSTKLATVEITDAAYGEFTVECSKACVIILQYKENPEDTDFTYVKIPYLESVNENKYLFSLTKDQVESLQDQDDAKIVIAIKGDVNIDGKLNTQDAVAIGKAILRPSSGLYVPLNGISKIVGDLYQDNKLNTQDAIAIGKAILRPNSGLYAALEW